MPLFKGTTSSDTQQDTLPSGVRGSEVSPSEPPYRSERTGREAREGLPRPSSGDYPTNPTTDHRYGANTGTGIYDSNSENIARTTYTISASDFRRTAPDSGQGIHARQYHGPDAGSVPIGSTTYVRYTPESGSGSDRAMPNSRIAERADVQPSISEDKTRYEGATWEPRLHQRDVPEEHGKVQSTRSAEQETKGPQGKGKSRKGSLSGLFGHGRQRDAPVVDRDVGTTGIENKQRDVTDAGKSRLSTSGAEPDNITGTTRAGERSMREPHSRPDTARASGAGINEPTTYARDFGTNRYAPTPYDAGNDSVPGTGMPGASSGIHGTGPDTGAVYDKTGRTGASTIGTERFEDAQSELSRTKGKPGTMDKIVGKAEAALGKSTGNPSMLAKGEAKAAGFSKN